MKREEILKRLIEEGHISIDELLILTYNNSNNYYIISDSDKLDVIIEKTRGSRAIAN